MYDGPIREGSRGGRDQFSWESVKGDKDREFYLGHSVKALVGHWQKNRDPYWYARSKEKAKSALEDEIKAVKDKEEELMLEALGMKKPTKKQPKNFGTRLQKHEVEGMLRRREKEDGDLNEAEDLGPRGLGFSRTAASMVASTTHEVLEGIGISEDSKPKKKKHRKRSRSPKKSSKRDRPKSSRRHHD